MHIGHSSRVPGGAGCGNGGRDPSLALRMTRGGWMTRVFGDMVADKNLDEIY